MLIITVDMATREIVTLQVGHYSNFVGTHFWNLQTQAFSYDPKKPSEVNNDVLFREGSTGRGVSTYLPRLISVDLKGSLRSQKSDGFLYDSPAEKLGSYSWDGVVDVHKAEPIPRNDFLRSLDSEDTLRLASHLENDDKDICDLAIASGPSKDAKHFELEDCVRSWTDFLMEHLHPKSVYLLCDYSHENEAEPFDVFGRGQQVLRSEAHLDDLENRVRYFAEECDHLQGFHLLVDTQDGFSGVGSHLCTYLSDEYGSKELLAVPLFDDVVRRRRRRSSSPTRPSSGLSQLLNTLLCLDQLTSSAGLVVPLSCVANYDLGAAVATAYRTFPFVDCRFDLPYHTSAILAATFDTATSVYRCKRSSSDLRDLVSAFNLRGRKVAAVSTIFPLPVEESAGIVETFEATMLHPVSLTASCDIVGSTDLVQHVTVRGLPPNLQAKRLDGRLSSLDDLVNGLMSRVLPSRSRFVTKCAEPCNVSAPFPAFFDRRISAHGMVSQAERQQGSDVISVPLLTGIHSSDNLSKTFNSLLSCLVTSNVNKLHNFTECGLESDDFVQAVENIKMVSSCYTS